MKRAELALTLALVAVEGCRAGGSNDAPGASARESPQASAQPAPLAVAPTSPPSATVSLGSGEGGPPPTPLRGDEVLGPDPLTKEAVGYTLSAVFRPADVMGPPRVAEVNSAGLDAARKATELRAAIDFSPTRMRVVFVGHGFVLPPDLELRARSDRYGHVVVWPEGASYRPLAPGATRALLGERRFDVAPIAAAGVTTRDESGRRIGIRTRKADVTTRAAQGNFEIGKLEGAGEGGVLLCRFLLDLMNAPPATALCGIDELPVRAELRWTSRGSLVFELTASLKRTDVPLSALAVPPSTASFAASPLPASGVTPLLAAHELAAFRVGDVDPFPGGSGGQPGQGGPGALGQGANTAPIDHLLLLNPTVELRVLYLDGIPVAWAGPGARGELRGLHRGRYVGQWRTFLGDIVEPATPVTVPGATQVGGTPDAGAGR